jgi:hypothetical protein
MATLACFGALLLYVVFAASHAPVWENGAVIFPVWIAAGFAWWLAIGLAIRGAIGLGSVLVGAIVLRVIALGSWPDLSDDIYRYVWEGELVARGVSPYAWAPDAQRLGGIAAELPAIHGAVNHPSISASYPPLTEGVFACIVQLAQALNLGAILLMRILFTLCDLFLIVPIVLLLRQSGKPDGLVLAWAWSPLVVSEFAGSGHFDSLGILLLLGSLAWFARTTPAARTWGQVLLAGAILVKYIPLAALPFVCRGTGHGKRALSVLLLCVFGFLPLALMQGGFSGLLSGLGEYGLRWQSSGLVHPHLAQFFDEFFAADGGLFDARRLVRISLGGIWFGLALFVWKRKLDAAHSTGILLGAFLVLTPTLHPWYVTWIVPFIALRPRASWIWLALSVPLTYTTLRAWKLEGVWEQSIWVQAAISVPFFLLLLLEMRNFMRQTTNR